MIWWTMSRARSLAPAGEQSRNRRQRDSAKFSAFSRSPGTSCKRSSSLSEGMLVAMPRRIESQLLGFRAVLGAKSLRPCTASSDAAGRTDASTEPWSAEPRRWQRTRTLLALGHNRTTVRQHRTLSRVSSSGMGVQTHDAGSDATNPWASSARRCNERRNRAERLGPGLMSLRQSLTWCMNGATSHRTSDFATGSRHWSVTATVLRGTVIASSPRDE